MTPAELPARLRARRKEGLARRRRRVEARDGIRLRIGGRVLVGFCSNDYLGLATDPGPAAVLARAAREWGTGSGAAHLVCGHTAPHARLEARMAEFLERDRALLFSTGYMANLGVLTTFAGRGDHVFEDRLNHASLLDGARLAGARLVRYRHRDLEDLQQRLAALPPGRGALVATDAVFSMDGDRAPLSGLARLCAQHRAWLLADDAHGFGVAGPGGRGSVAAAGLDQHQVPLLMVTLGKALGGFGALVAGPDEVIEALVQWARPWVYTTALPPALAEAMVDALGRLEAAEDRRRRLAGHIQRLRAGVAALGLELLPSGTPVQALVLGSAERALAWSAALEDAGFLVPAIRPPTVPAGTARLRIALSAAHRARDVDGLVAALGRAMEVAG